MTSVAKFNRAKNRFATGRSLLQAKVKWIRDPCLDEAVAREKNLRTAISYTRRLPNPSGDGGRLPVAAVKFFERYPSVFNLYSPGKGLHPRVRLTPRALSLHKEHSSLLASLPHRLDAATRLAKLLLLGRSCRAPISLLQGLAWDLGLPEDFASSLVPEFPDLFSVCQLKGGELGIEVVPSAATRRLAVASELQRRAAERGDSARVEFPDSLPVEFRVKKEVVQWVRAWEAVPYVSAYESGVHVAGPESNVAEKWAVGLIHEVLWLSVAKKAEREAVVRLLEWVGVERPLAKAAVVRHPGMVYYSNKLKTQTLMLREAYNNDCLLRTHPILPIRHAYAALLNSFPSRTAT